MKIGLQPDQLDAENISALSVHSGYGLVRKQIEKVLSGTAEALQTASTWEETRRLQGVCEGLRLALATPSALVSEIRKRSK